MEKINELKPKRSLEPAGTGNSSLGWCSWALITKHDFTVSPYGKLRNSCTETLFPSLACCIKSLLMPYANQSDLWEHEEPCNLWERLGTLPGRDASLPNQPAELEPSSLWVGLSKAPCPQLQPTCSTEHPRLSFSRLCGLLSNYPLHYSTGEHSIYWITGSALP